MILGRAILGTLRAILGSLGPTGRATPSFTGTSLQVTNLASSGMSAASLSSSGPSVSGLSSTGLSVSNLESV